jgi:hypothetical protein
MPAEKAPGTHWIGGWGGPHSGHGCFWKTDISSPSPQTNLIALVDLKSVSILAVLFNVEFQSNRSFRNIKLILRSLTNHIKPTETWYRKQQSNKGLSLFWYWNVQPSWCLTKWSRKQWMAKKKIRSKTQSKGGFIYDSIGTNDISTLRYCYFKIWSTYSQRCNSLLQLRSPGMWHIIWFLKIWMNGWMQIYFP